MSEVDPRYVRKYSGSCCFAECHVFRRMQSSLQCGECLYVDESPKYRIMCDNPNCTERGEIHQMCFATLEKNLASRLRGNMRPGELKKAIWTYDKLRPFKKCFCGGNLDCERSGATIVDRDINAVDASEATTKKKSRGKKKQSLPASRVVSSAYRSSYIEDDDDEEEDWAAEYMFSNPVKEVEEEEEQQQVVPTAVDFPELTSPTTSTTTSTTSSHYQSRVPQSIPQKLISHVSGPGGEKLTVRTQHDWLRHLYGRNGKNINMLRDNSRCSIHVDEEFNRVSIVIKGKTCEDRNCGVRLVTDNIESIIKRLDKDLEREQAKIARERQVFERLEEARRLHELEATRADLFQQLRLM